MGALAGVSFDERGVVREWENRPLFVRDCAFVRGAIDCSQQSAPEDPFARAMIGQAAIYFDGSQMPGLRTRREMLLGNLIADTMLAAASQSDGAVAAVVNSGGIRTSLNAGAVSFENALAVLPFGNTLAVLDLNGEDLIAALDHGVSQPGEGVFPQVAGLKLSTAPPCCAWRR